MRKILALLLAGASAMPLGAHICIALFPLQQNPDAPLSEWIRYAPAESFFRLTYDMSGIRVWDPQFLFLVDSTGYTLESDSLLLVHQRRWQWNAALGGGYRLVGDSLIINICLVRIEPDKGLLRKDIFVLRCLSHALCRELAPMVAKILDTLGVGPPSGFFWRENQRFGSVHAAYATYLCGYGYEMRNNYSGAISAYSRVTDIYPAFAMAICREAMVRRQAGDIERARFLFMQAVTAAPFDPMIVAESADFMIEYEPRLKSSKFVESKRKILEETSRGLCVVGKAYFAQGYLQRSLAMLTRSLVFGPRDLTSDYYLGSAYFALGNFELASECFNRLVQYRPDYVPYYVALGTTYRSVGKLMESVRMLENAVRLSENNPLSLSALAHTYFDLKWHEKAYALLMRIKNKWPDFDPTDINLGVVEWHIGKRKEALMLMKAAVRSKAARRAALNNIGNVYFLQEKYREALKAYRAADRVAGIREATVVYNMGLSYLKMSKLNKARKCFEDVVTLAPTRLDALEHLQRIARRQGDLQREERYVQHMLEISPGNEETLEAMVRILIQQKRFDEAVQYVEAFLEEHPESKRIMETLAQLYCTMEWYEVSVMKYEALLADYPNDASVLLGLGRALYGQLLKKGVRPKEFDYALEVLNRCHQLLPEKVELHILAADLHLLKNDTAAAVVHLQRAADLTKDRSQKNAILGRIARLKKNQIL